MRQEDTVEYNALNWVKKELDEVLDQTRLALESYLEEEPGDEEQLAQAKALLKQVHGTLQMVELYGAAMLAEEMEFVAQDLIDGKIKKRDDAFEVLMRALVQLPDYLEHIQMGHRDIPLVLLPLLNDLRTSRDANLISESVLFFPNLEVDPEEPVTAEAGEAQGLARKLRHAFQLGLLGWFRDKDVPSSLNKLADVTNRLFDSAAEAPSRRFWWVAAALGEALNEGGLESGVTTKSLMGKVDRQIKRLIDEGEGGVGGAGTEDLLKNMLYYVAQAPARGERVVAVKKAFRLDQMVPEASVLDAARQRMSGPNLDILNTVSQAIREDLTEVKDALDVFMHADTRKAEDLEPLHPKLVKIAETLGMLGLGEARRLVTNEAELVDTVIKGEQGIDEDLLMKIAGVMLSVESAINDFMAGRSSGMSQTEVNEAIAEAPTGEQPALPQSEFQGVMSAVIRETLTDMNKAKDAILEFVAAPQNIDQLAETPDTLERVKGAISMMPVGDVAPVLEALKRYIAERVLAAKHVPNSDELDALADVITSVEFYLENIAEGRGAPPAMIEVGTASMARLGYPIGAEPSAEIERLEAQPAPEFEEEAEVDQTAELEPMLDVDELSESGEEEEALDLTIESADFDLSEPAEVEETLELDTAGLGEALEAGVDETLELDTSGMFEQAEEAPAEPEAAAPEPEPVPEKERPQPLVGEVDEEILDIFLEEAEEEIERIKEFFPKWEQNSGDEEALVTIRRSFHTLKGSGRLVGAQLIGEFAWNYENLLNRVIDKTVKPALYIFEAMNKAVDVLPELVAQVRGEGEPTIDVYALMDEVEAMSKPGYAEKVMGKQEQESEADRNAFIEEDEGGPESLGEPEPESTEGGESAPATAPAESGGDTDATQEAPTANHDDTLFVVSDDEEGTGETEITHELQRPDLSGESTDLIDLSASAQPVAGTDFDITLELPTPDFDLGVEEAEAAPVEPEPRIDPALYEIYRSEAEQHLQTVRDQLDVASGEPLAVSDELLRALHTINGSSRTAEVPELSTVYTALENYARDCQGKNVPLPVKALDLIARTVGHTETVLEALGQPDADVPAGDALKAEAEALEVPAVAEPEAPPAAAPPPVTAPAVPEAGAEAAEPPDLPGEQDMELVEIFLEEAMEIMDASDGTLQAWEDNHDDREAVNELQRQLHTLKGGARMAGFKNIGNLSHAVESLIIAVVEGQAQATGPLFEALHRTFDRLSDMLEKAKNQEPIHAAPGLIQELDAYRRGQAPATAATAEAAPAPEPVPEAEAAPELETVEAAPAPEPEPTVPVPAAETPSAEPSEGEGEEAPRRVERRATPRSGPQELIRVRSDLLDNLVNNAGEVNIYHARLEEQITSFGFNLGEFGQTITRLREQLRKLELETEAQIRSSFAKEHGPDAAFDEDFDPLEMDRYSTLQQLSRALAESVNDLISIQDLLNEQVRDTETLLLQQSRVSTDLQEGLMRTRMVQFTGTVPRLRRIVRQTAGELGKKVELDIAGEGSELDRSVLDRMVAPLEHMLRNAIAHGIEDPKERLAKGKDEAGHIHIEIGREGSEVVIRVADDGGGINIDAIRAKAIKQGMIRENDRLSDYDLMQLILESGFSTAQQVDQIAGRGVGMDVVNNEIKQLGGVLRIDSMQGQGTTFTVNLPFTLAINQALLVQSGDDIFAIPLTSIEGIVRYPAAELKDKYLEDAPAIEYAAYTYELKHLGGLLGMSQPSLDDSGALYPVLLVRSGQHRVALQVEGVMGNREIVVKPVGPQISQARGISGATILGDGRVVLILDVPSLVRIGAGIKLVYEAPAEKPEEEKQLMVMVVDDSITIRKVTQRMLQRNQYGVMLAKDGVDAVAQLQDAKPDLMLLDIEMPRMDGYELAQHIRNDERLRDIPIIMITSRTGEKHRQRAMDIGVNRYLGKPYQESDLLDNIHNLLEETGKVAS
jgi:chemosensory pili system protein ChpA (sensor histidine kinase/response regulator)